MAFLLTFLVVETEGLLEFFVQRVGVLLYDELGGQQDELLETQLARSFVHDRNGTLPGFAVIGVYRVSTLSVEGVDEFFENFVVVGLAHQTQNAADHFARDGAVLLAVEIVEGLFQN